MKRERIPSVLPAGLNRLDADRVSSARRARRAANTAAAYGAQWRRFLSWCEHRGAEPAPAAPETAAAYLTELGAVRKIATVKVAAAAIAAFHRAARLAPPTADPVVTEALAGIARRQAADPRCAPKQAPTFTHEDALAMMDAAVRRRRSGRGVESARGAAERGPRSVAPSASTASRDTARGGRWPPSWRAGRSTASPSRARTAARSRAAFAARSGVAIARAGGWNSVESVKRYTNETELEHGAIATAFGAQDSPALGSGRDRRDARRRADAR